ncbi:MAG: murein hydrolase activator EnvC family protein [bacterium]
MFFRVLLLVVLTMLPGELLAQNEIKSHHVRLKKIRDEIHSVEKEIAASQKKESSVLDQLNTVDLDIDLAQSVIQNLRKEQKKKNRQIAQIEENLEATKTELERLKEAFRKRLVYTYKYGRVKDLELLLTARSINDGLLWLEYQKRLARHHYRNYLKIKDKQAEIARDKDLLTVELQEKKALLANKIREEKKLRGQKKQRQKLLDSIRQNTDLLRQRLAQKERAAAEMQRMIVKLEQAPTKVPLVRPETLFAELKGRMIWPTSGKIIARFGRYKHPELKTVTENIGIDIQAPMGSPVQAVASGKVTAIEWQRGLGNIVIIRHYGGYYSVYTHLEEILINLLQEVQMGEVIGNVGESGSLKGPVLHFEIWKGTEKLNPEQWLGKSQSA